MSTEHSLLLLNWFVFRRHQVNVIHLKKHDVYMIQIKVCPLCVFTKPNPDCWFYTCTLFAHMLPSHLPGQDPVSVGFEYFMKAIRPRLFLFYYPGNISEITCIYRLKVIKPSLFIPGSVPVMFYLQWKMAAAQAGCHCLARPPGRLTQQQKLCKQLARAGPGLLTVSAGRARSSRKSSQKQPSWRALGGRSPQA